MYKTLQSQKGQKEKRHRRRKRCSEKIPTGDRAIQISTRPQRLRERRRVRTPERHEVAAVCKTPLCRFLSVYFCVSICRSCLSLSQSLYQSVHRPFCSVGSGRAETILTAKPVPASSEKEGKRRRRSAAGGMRGAKEKAERGPPFSRLRKRRKWRVDFCGTP